MKKVLIISAAFVLFFAALGYFIWWQQYGDHNIVQPAQTTRQPLPPASPDTGIVTQPDFNFAHLSDESLHLYSRPMKSDSTLVGVIGKEDLDRFYIQSGNYTPFEYYCIELINHSNRWHQTSDSLWVLEDELKFVPRADLFPHELQKMSKVLFQLFNSSMDSPITTGSHNWISPDCKYIMSLGWHGIGKINTTIIDTVGNVIFSDTKPLTSPIWHHNNVFVRGMYEDDGVYMIDLTRQTVSHIFTLKTGGDPDYGCGDGYYAWPTGEIDTLKKRLKIPFVRVGIKAKSYRSMLYHATISFNGDQIKLDSTEN